METTAIELRPDAPLSVTQVKAHVDFVRQVIREVMVEGVHYGLPPGIEEKEKGKARKMLFKPGTHTLCLAFRFRPEYAIEPIDYEDGHREYRVMTTLYTASGHRAGQGVGSCSSREAKYRYRWSARTCPNCHAETIMKSKFGADAGGWFCWQKKGGCGAKWPAGAAEIESQDIGRVENPDIADCFNTVLKIAKKRSAADAVIATTACDDMLCAPTPDVEDLDEDEPDDNKPKRKAPVATAAPAKDPIREPKRKNDDVITVTPTETGVVPNATAVDGGPVHFADTDQGRLIFVSDVQRTNIEGAIKMGTPLKVKLGAEEHGGRKLVAIVS